MQPINNYVLLKPAVDTSVVSTKFGNIYLDNTYNPEQFTPIVFEVLSVPRRLNYSLAIDHTGYMEWHTEMELQVGDLVWTYTLASLKATRIDKNYLIPYNQLVVAKRGEQIIPINGYLLLEPITESPALTSMLIILEDKGTELKERGVVRYMGTPNSCYNKEGWHDQVDVHEGDTVILRKMAYSKVETSPFHQKLGNYLVCQRKDIFALCGGVS
ncbi:MAG: co-chaperone GroES family protein [Lentimicrobiaceae bacterium]